MARKQNIFIYIAYIPPLSRSELYAKCCDSIGDIFNAAEPSDLVLVMGDFNLPSTEWTFDKEVNCCLPSNLTSDECLFVDSMLRCNLNQINHIPNVNGRMLDLIFTNELNIISVSQSLAPFALNDHHHIPMEILFDVREMSVNSNHQSDAMSYNFRKTNVTEFNQQLGNINWHDEFTGNINMNVNIFYDILSRCCDRTVPIKKIQSNNNPPWYDTTLINLKNLKTKAYQKMKKSNSETDKMAFIDINSKFESYFNISHENYIQTIQNSIKSDPKTFWKYFATKREVKGYPATMHLGESKSSSSQEIANMFAKFFQSTYKPEDINDFKNLQTSNDSSTSITTPTISEDDLTEAINHLGDGCGPDGIPSYMLKNHAEQFAPPLCILFNMSLSTGIFPTRWKSSKVTPIFKSGKRNDVSCYRGISTTSMIPKLFEIVVCKSFKSIIPRHLSNCQHGFIPGRSTTTNLVEFTSYIVKSIEQHRQVDAVYTDFRKAFDSISHCKALESLQSFGFSTDFVIWFCSYLSDRSQFIEIDGRTSNLIKASSGVPQGSHVGPWIFLIFINDIVNVIVNSSVLMFADDLKIFKIITNEHDSTLLQDDINRISEWCEANQLHLNINKCKVMSFHRKKSPITMDYNINGVNINRASELKDLGVMFVGNMTFTKHMDLIIAKANSMFGFISRWTREIMDQRTLFILYFSYVRSQLEYAAQVWCPFYQDYIDRLESIQKQALLFIMKKTDWNYDHDIPYYLNVARLPSYKVRCNNYKIPTLANRRKILGSIFIANVLLGKTDSPYILGNLNIYTPTRNLRQHNFLQPDQHRTNYGEHEPINTMVKMFNDVEELFDFSISSDCFKNKLKKHFL